MSGRGGETSEGSSNLTVVSDEVSVKVSKPKEAGSSLHGPVVNVPQDIV